MACIINVNYYIEKFAIWNCSLLAPILHLVCHSITVHGDLQPKMISGLTIPIRVFHQTTCVRGSDCLCNRLIDRRIAHVLCTVTFRFKQHENKLIANNSRSKIKAKNENKKKRDGKKSIRNISNYFIYRPSGNMAKGLYCSRKPFWLLVAGCWLGVVRLCLKAFCTGPFSFWMCTHGLLCGMIGTLFTVAFYLPLLLNNLHGTFETCTTYRFVFIFYFLRFCFL